MYHETVDKIEALLGEHDVPYTKFEHEPVRTSEEAAQVRPEYTLSQGAKALIIRVKKNGEKYFVQFVVPGDARFDVKKARGVLSTNDIRFASEEEVSEITGGVKPGGVPPFGVLWDLPVYVDHHVLANDELIFNAGDRSVSIALRSEDYERVVAPTVAELV
ncbi:hypothetical protein GVX82_01655 [Patescibacteria group bacterium]|jgi:prolyl-tRNA editing enzyme YbaK/EbsC (Cys-tRNA(Pro) deacylase)|nr:hypothetical protein [Patescibacteria group bacterium]